MDTFHWFWMSRVKERRQTGGGKGRKEMYGEDRRHAQYTITTRPALGTFCTWSSHLCFSVFLSCSCSANAVELPHFLCNAWIAALRASFKPICVRAQYKTLKMSRAFENEEQTQRYRHRPDWKLNHSPSEAVRNKTQVQ